MYDLFKSLIKVSHVTQCIFYSNYCLTCFSSMKLISKLFSFLLLILYTHSYGLLSVTANLHPFKTAVLSTFQSCPTLCDPLSYSLPDSSVHGILQARTLEWVALPSSRGPSQLRDWTASLLSPVLAGRFFTTSAPWEAQAVAFQAKGNEDPY